jgi:hypothetical protein
MYMYENSRRCVGCLFGFICHELLGQRYDFDVPGHGNPEKLYLKCRYFRVFVLQSRRLVRG